MPLPSANTDTFPSPLRSPTPSQSPVRVVGIIVGSGFSTDTARVIAERVGRLHNEEEKAKVKVERLGQKMPGAKVEMGGRCSAAWRRREGEAVLLVFLSIEWRL